MTPFELIPTTTDPAVPGAADVRGRRRALEVPTLALLAGTYGAWLAATLAYGRWPLWVVAPVTAVLITLHSSLQHEIVHGHPTRWDGFNRLLGILPLSLWLPFERYRHLHHVHHIDARLTDPLDDPESFYFTRADWAHRTRFTRFFLQLQQTLAGRVLLGSFWRIGMFWHSEWRLVRTSAQVRTEWLEHLLWCLPVILWIKLVCGMPVWIYFLAMAVPANGILLIRSFAEHRALPQVPMRIALVEGSWILGPLFLFNSLHALHHETPGIAWYELPSRYRRNRERLLAANGGLVYSTYFEVARRYLFRPHDAAVHPTDRVPAASASPQAGRA
jgi:fatty acid desaturase